MEDQVSYENGHKAASSKDGVAKRIKEVNLLERMVTVDDNEFPLSVQMEFSGKSGNFKISTHITTNHVSMLNEDVNEAVRQQISNMIKHATDLMIQRKKDWSEKPETNQIKLNL